MVCRNERTKQERENSEIHNSKRSLQASAERFLLGPVVCFRPTLPLTLSFPLDFFLWSTWIRVTKMDHFFGNLFTSQNCLLLCIAVVALGLSYIFKIIFRKRAKYRRRGAASSNHNHINTQGIIETTAPPVVDRDKNVSNKCANPSCFRCTAWSKRAMLRQRAEKMRLGKESGLVLILVFSDRHFNFYFETTLAVEAKEQDSQD